MFFQNIRPPFNIAHRGASSLAPENTFAAIKKAYEVGAHICELDVQLTKDGEVVIFHDKILDRTSNAREIFLNYPLRSIHEFTYDELRFLDYGSWFIKNDPFGQIAANKISIMELKDYRGQALPLLRHVLALAKNLDFPLNLEIKDLGNTPGDRIIIEKVVREIKRADMIDMVLISSFRLDYLSAIKKACPSVATAVLYQGNHYDPLRLLKEINADAYHTNVNLSSEMISQLRENSFYVNIFTVNHQETMRELFAKGVSGIFTDFPQRFQLCS
ncbi:glycerophosphodiester phosphodiesterase [Desulfonauticus submarinus]